MPELYAGAPVDEIWVDGKGIPVLSVEPTGRNLLER
jgi:hypothetical protein